MTDDEQILLSFYTDIIGRCLFGQQISFLSKYQHIENYEEIIIAQEKILKLSYQIVKKNIQKPSQLSALLINQPQNIIKPLGYALINQLTAIKRAIIRKQITLGSKYLKAHNWSIKNVISCNSSINQNRFLMTLLLIFVQEEESNTMTISLELDVKQVQYLLGQLKQIKKKMIV